jgi:hypothetical protein
MSPPRIVRGATKNARQTPSDRKSHRMRNYSRPRLDSKRNREFDPQAFLFTIIGEGRKALLFPKKQTIFAQGDPARTQCFICRPAR